MSKILEDRLIEISKIADKQQEEIEQLIISLQAQEELTMNEHIKVERLQNIIKEAKMYCEDAKQEYENGDYNVSTTQLAIEEGKNNIKSILNILNGDLEDYWRSDKE